jgi:D-alanyl-lipoteichoic acid acyltransferase DltB (MBOAT superfamily)
MLFNSAAFLLIFLPLTLIAYWLVDRHERLRIAVLLFFSLVFYGIWNPEFVPLMVGLIVLNWAAARWYARVQDGRIVTMAIIATLGVLAAEQPLFCKFPRGVSFGSIAQASMVR